MRTHTGEKPYACDKCTYRAAQKSDLKRHMRTHTGEKPYACDKCTYRAALKGTLERHMRTHKGEKPYACDKCTYRAARKGTLKKHMHRKHSAPTNSSSFSPVKIPSSKAKLRRCAKPFTLFKFKEFASASDPGFLGL